MLKDGSWRTRRKIMPFWIFTQRKPLNISQKKIFLRIFARKKWQYDWSTWRRLKNCAKSRLKSSLCTSTRHTCVFGSSNKNKTIDIDPSMQEYVNCSYEVWFVWSNIVLLDTSWNSASVLKWKCTSLPNSICTIVVIERQIWWRFLTKYLNFLSRTAFSISWMEGSIYYIRIDFCAVMLVH